VHPTNIHCDMENSKDIGKVFREKLESIDKSPDPKVWNAIYADLQKKKKRRILFIPFWMKSLGIFSLGVIFSWILFYNHSSDDAVLQINPLHLPETESTDNNLKKNTNKQTTTAGNRSEENNIHDDDEMNIRDTDSGQSTSASSQKMASGENIYSDTQKSGITKNKKIGTSPNKKTSKAGKNFEVKTSLKRKSDRPSIDKESKHNKSGKNQILNDGNSTEITQSDAIDLAKHDLVNNKENSTIGLESSKNPEENTEKKIDSLNKKKEKKPLKETIKEEKDSTATKEKTGLNVFGYGAPTSSGFFAKKSPIDNRLTDNSRKTELSWSYGAYLIYDATPKWSLRFGVKKTNMKLITENASVNGSNYTGINYSKFSNAAIYSQTAAETMTLKQEISYFEIPLELKYALINKRFGLNAYGGISYMFLDKNAVYGETPNGKIFELGSMKNLASNSYSINLGVGTDYKFTPRLRLNIEPMFSYHLVDYKNSGKINPFTFGILTGLQFSFTNN